MRSSFIPATILIAAIGMGGAVPAQAQNAADPDTLLSPASLEKIRNVTLSGSKTSALDATVARTLGIGQGGESMTVKQFRAETAVGLYVFTIPVKPASADIIFSFRDLSGVTYSYLSDGTRTLRAAMASDADGNRVLKTEDAEEGFRSTLRAWGLIAPRVKFP
jgi:hypothetical protein